jgi:hypothetical protein
MNAGTSVQKLRQNREIPGRPTSPRPASLALRRIATSLIQGHGNTLTLNLSRALEVGLIQRPERLHPWIRGPTCMQDSGKHLRCPLPPTQERNQRRLEEGGAKWHKSQASQPWTGRPPTAMPLAQLRVEVTLTAIPAYKTSYTARTNLEVV